MYGHGAVPPDPRWPNGAKIAVQIVLNYEEGGENCLLHGDDASEAFLSESVGAVAWPGQRHWNMESVYEYGARAGFWRLHRLFTRLRIPLTVYGVATALARNPAQVTAMQEAGWEVASHGLKWIEYKDHAPEAEERADMIGGRSGSTTETLRARSRPWAGTLAGARRTRYDLAAEMGGIAWNTSPTATPTICPIGCDSVGRSPTTRSCRTRSTANDMRFATAAGLQLRRSVSAPI